MKLIMQLSISFEKAAELYKGLKITQLQNCVQIETECSLEEAISLISRDQSTGDRSIELRRG